MRDYIFLNSSNGHTIEIKVFAGTDMSGIIGEFRLIGYNLV